METVKINQLKEGDKFLSAKTQELGEFKVEKIINEKEYHILCPDKTIDIVKPDTDSWVFESDFILINDSNND